MGDIDYALSGSSAHGGGEQGVGEAPFAAPRIGRGHGQLDAPDADPDQGADLEQLEADVTIQRKLGLTPAEFHRHLPYALRGYRHWSDGAGDVVAKAPHRRITIQVESLPPRRLSEALSVPCCRVSFLFEGFNGDDAQAFMANFDRAFQRGGG